MGDKPAPHRLVLIGLTIAIFVAPFLALLFRVEAGFGLMAVALVATALVLRDAVASMPERLRRGTRALVAINIALALACVAAVVWLALGG